MSSVTLTLGRLVGAILFGFMITNHVIDRSPTNPQVHQLWRESRHLAHTIKEKDINDMVLAGHQVNEIVKQNTFSGDNANSNSTHGENDSK